MIALFYNGPRDISVTEVNCRRIAALTGVGSWFKDQARGSVHWPVDRSNRVVRGPIHVGQATPSWIIRHEFGLHPPSTPHEQFGGPDETSAKVALGGRLR